MVNKKLNIKKLGVAVLGVVIVLVLIIVGITGVIRKSKEKKTIEYRLTNVGYTSNEISILKSNLDSKELKEIVKKDYNSSLSKLAKNKYFIYSNLEFYYSYISDNDDVSIDKVIALINTNSDKDWYDVINDTDTSKGKLMLVNRYNKLSSDYVPEDLTDISSRYSYSGKQASEVILDSLYDLIDAGKESGFTLLVTQGYRSYQDQEEAYNSIESANGREYADEVAARAGHSEYQTGLSVSLGLYSKDANVTDEDITSWLKDNSYKYGFIIRYPEGKSDITGFNAENNRIRYVGTDAASKIHSENITFDEYYAYYVKNAK